MSTQTRWWIGLVAAVLVSLSGQADAMPEPWRHIFVIGGTIGTAIAAYMIRPFTEPKA